MEQLFGDYRIQKDQKDDLDTQPQEDDIKKEDADETSKLLKHDDEDG